MATLRYAALVVVASLAAGPSAVFAPAAIAGDSAATAPPPRPGSPASLRAEVQSLVSGASEPPPEALARAELFARTATRMAPREPWGPLAHCDIAVRWGDRALVDRCLDRLVAAAPEHVETRRAVAALGPRTPVVAILAWSLLAVAALATGGHAVRARLVARRGRAPSLPEAGDPAAAGPITGAAPPGSRAHS